MHAVELVFVVGWIAFWVYWLVAAFFVKRGQFPRTREFGVRAALFVVVVVLVRLRLLRRPEVGANPWRVGIGLALFAAGLALAVWARVHIGRNWGTPMSRKAEPELVTAGPYRLVRHPIYTGILTAGAGTAVTLRWQWLIVVALAGGYFIYSAVVEERMLTAQFPDDYPAYRRRSKMLVPYLF